MSADEGDGKLMANFELVPVVTLKSVKEKNLSVIDKSKW